MPCYKAVLLGSRGASIKAGRHSSDNYIKLLAVITK